MRYAAYTSTTIGAFPYRYAFGRAASARTDGLRAEDRRRPNARRLSLCDLIRLTSSHVAFCKSLAGRKFVSGGCNMIRKLITEKRAMAARLVDAFDSAVCATETARSGKS